MIKLSYIRKLPNGKYRVFSRKGKNLGTYDSEKEAEKRLRQIEYFKHVKASLSSDELKYSNVVRYLRKHDVEKLPQFQKTFKENFDEAIKEGFDNAEDVALFAAMKNIDIEIKKEATIDDRILKFAAATIEMGDPETAGKGIADIVKFLTQRISIENRQNSLNNLKEKIWNMDENDIASKQTPPSASLGQSITFIKTILIGHEPKYIREVIRYICKNL